MEELLDVEVITKSPDPYTNPKVKSSPGNSSTKGGAKLSDKITVTLKSGTETSTTLAAAEQESTDINAFGGALIFTFGFGF